MGNAWFSFVCGAFLMETIIYPNNLEDTISCCFLSRFVTIATTCSSMKRSDSRSSREIILVRALSFAKNLCSCIISEQKFLYRDAARIATKGMAMAEKLTKKQRAVLESIERCISEKGYGPTVREICADLSLRSPSTVHVHLKTLEQKGYIVRDPLKSRSISLSPEYGESRTARNNVVEPSFTKVVNVPLVGNVAAGEPILAEENITDTISLPTDIVGDSPSFMLSVRGESMIEAGINDGDYVVVKEQPVADNGDIVVAIIDDGATVKRFYKEKGHVRLQPENSSMDPIITSDCTIAGKVVAVFRRI